MNFKYELEPQGDYAFIDMKSFYASCELVSRGLHPLRHILIVMSITDNSSGLILASSPMAKKLLGIKNVTRHWELPTELENPAVKNLIIAPPRMRYYIEQNLKIQEVLRRYAPDEDILWYSIDEGVVDLTKSLNYFVPGPLSRKAKLTVVSEMIQKDIVRATGIFSTIGMSNSNPLLAKLALDNEAKHSPTMRALWNYEDVQQKVWGLSEMTDFWGIGRRTKRTLHLLGIDSIKELAHTSPQLLHRKLGIIGLQLYHHANGIDRTKIQERYHQKEKNIGNSQILPKDYTAKEIVVIIHELAEQVAVRIRRKKFQAGLVHLFIGYSRDEPTKGFSRQLKITPTNDTKKLTDQLVFLFHKFYDGQSLIRQIGVTYSKFTEVSSTQLNLFEEPMVSEKREKIDRITDKIRDKYGFVSIVRASSTLEHARSINRSRLVGGHDGGAGGLDGL